MLLVEQGEKVGVDYLVGTQMLISHPTYLMLTIGLSNFDRKLIKLRGSCLLDEVDEDEIVQTLLKVLSYQLKVNFGRVKNVNCWKARTRLSFGSYVGV